MQVQQGGLAPTYVEPEELRRRLNHGEAFSIIDARTPDNYEASGYRIPGSLRIPAPQLGNRLQEIPRGRTPVLVADVEEAHPLAVTLMELGFADIYLIEGGFEAWRRGGGNVEAIRGS